MAGDRKTNVSPILYDGFADDVKNLVHDFADLIQELTKLARYANEEMKEEREAAKKGK